MAAVSASTEGSCQERPFREALARFLDECCLDDSTREDFQFTSLDDLRTTIIKLQNEQRPKKDMRNLNRIKAFLEGMEEYSKLIEVYLNVSELLAFVWVSSSVSSARFVFRGGAES